MGCTFGNSIDPNFHVYTAEPITKQWKKLFEILQLSENDVGNLYLVFQKMDKTKTQKLVNNLISNAIKYSYKDSIIEVTLKDNILSVKDFGRGISKDEEKNIFKIEKNILF